MIVYHGSTEIIKIPDVSHSKRYLDFGKGFYVTTFENQAKKWAQKYETPMLNKYEYDENVNLNIKEFTLMTEEWLDFIIDCRNGKEHNYDIVIGAMADDQIYNYISALMSHEITREAFWELAKFNHPTHQIVFCTENALKCIKFIGAEEIENGTTKK